MSSVVCPIVESISRSPEDEEITSLAQQQIRQGSYLQLRHLSCEVIDGCVTLGGVLGSYWLKQVAQSAVQRVPGIQRVRNEIVVIP
jgi:osmotically-inducible protein OsmY